jgi:membrane-associated phospholipid phosphatase
MRRVGKANFWFAGWCAALLTVATVIVARVEDLPVRDPDGVAMPTYIRFPLILGIAFLLDVLPRAAVRSRTDLSRLGTDFLAVVKERWRRRHVLFALSGLGTWYVCYAAFRNLKSYVPFVRGKDNLFDDRFERIDKAIWFGHDPAQVMHSLFGTHFMATIFSLVYIAWIVFIPVSLAIALMWTRAPAAASWFVTAIAVDWLLGAAGYFAFPTVGPVYSDPATFAHLKHTYATGLVNDLASSRAEVLANPWATDAVQSVAAFPSLHVGMMVTVCLFVMYLPFPRWLKVTSWVFLVLTIVSTIYIGWHFSTDAVGGAVVGAIALYLAAIGTGNHVGGRMKLIDRGSYDDHESSQAESASATSLA